MSSTSRSGAEALKTSTASCPVIVARTSKSSPRKARVRTDRRSASSSQRPICALITPSMMAAEPPARARRRERTQIAYSFLGLESASAHGVAHGPEAIDLDLDDVAVTQKASLRGADARRSSRGDDVTRQQRHRAREPSDDLGWTKDEVGGRPLLQQFTVNARAQSERLQVIDLIQGDERRTT